MQGKRYYPYRLKKLKIDATTFDELPKLKEMFNSKIKEARILNKDIRKTIKTLENQLKLEKSNLNRCVQDEAFFKEEQVKVVQRFKARYYKHRKWGRENPIVALERSLPPVSSPTLKTGVSVGSN